MAKSQACYRKLKKYKYQLMKEYTVRDIEIEGLAEDVDTDFIALTVAGVLTVKNRYAWDGPSGPTIDTKSFMRGSLVHDALYQLMRGKYLDYKKHRDYADELLRKMCVDDGMFKLWARYVYKLLRMFGEKNARPSEEPQDEIIFAP